jgi:uncharacterized repeat protein (TIGR04042 family)
MPEVHFEVRWPSGLTRSYYSPSTIVFQHISAGESYGLPDFLARTELAMNAASERVRAKFGYACSSAMDTLAQIRQTAQTEHGERLSPDARVTVLAMK